jgi:hypothetical protein
MPHIKNSRFHQIDVLGQCLNIEGIYDSTIIPNPSKIQLASSSFIIFENDINLNYQKRGNFIAAFNHTH